MPKGVSRNPRTDKRLKKNRRIEKAASISKAKATPPFVEVGPPMTFQQALESVRDLTTKEAAPPQEVGTLTPPQHHTDDINHPPHYTVGGIETIDFIEAKMLGYHLGQVIKYITRAKYKGNALEDLKKAQWYLNREISNKSKA